MKKVRFFGIPRPNYLKEFLRNSFSGKVFFFLMILSEMKRSCECVPSPFFLVGMSHRNLNMKKTLAVNTSVNFSIVPPEKEILIKEFDFSTTRRLGVKMSVLF